jgi:hypothetical protein
MKEHLKEICTCAESLHFSHLLQYISAYNINSQQIEEFKLVLENAIDSVKEMGQCEVINWGGQFDLVVTPLRIHLMLPIKSFELPIERRKFNNV